MAILALLLGLCAVMLHRAPVRRYVVACERATQVSCALEQVRPTGTRRWRVSLGPDASAVVRVMPQRRGPGRVLLYLASPARAVFAAEFEGADAEPAAAAAAARLNRVLRGPAPATARIEAVPPPVLRWLAWAGLGLTGVLILAGCRAAWYRGPSSRTLALPARAPNRVRIDRARVDRERR